MMLRNEAMESVTVNLRRRVANLEVSLSELAMKIEAMKQARCPKCDVAIFN